LDDEGVSAKALAPLPLPEEIRSRYTGPVNGLRMHYLESGWEPAGKPVVLLLHGFPELAFSWRKVMPMLAAGGYRVIAPDQRGYGRTTGWDTRYDGDLASFRFQNLIQDLLGLLSRLAIASVQAVVGHDFGSWVAGTCGLIRPDVFPAVGLSSAPFVAPPPLAALSELHESDGLSPVMRLAPELAALARPRKHYHSYYATPQANDDMLHCKQGVHDFLRAYFHYKSADWPDNRPYPLNGWNANELAKLPTYYVMDESKNMAQTVSEHMPVAAAIDRCEWLRDDELAVYAAEFGRTGFQGGLQWYRCRLNPRIEAEWRLFAGRTLDVPSCFLSGASDWGVRQSPGALENMQSVACTSLLTCELIEGAGHWVQQEQASAFGEALVAFLERAN